MIYFKGEIIVGQIGDGLIVLEFDDQYRIYAETEDFYSTETEALGEQVRRSALSLERVEFTDGFFSIHDVRWYWKRSITGSQGLNLEII